MTASNIAAAAAPTPIPALAPALRVPLVDSSLLEVVVGEEVESVGATVLLVCHFVTFESVILRFTRKLHSSHLPLAFEHKHTEVGVA